MRLVATLFMTFALVSSSFSVAAAHVPTEVTSTNVRHVSSTPGVGGHVAVEGDVLLAGAFGLGMDIFDISDRANPVQVSEWKPQGGRADAYPDAMVKDGKMVASLSGNRSGYTSKTEFFDLTDPSNPIKIGELTGIDGNDHTGNFFDERDLWVPAGGPSLRLYDATPLFAETPAVPVPIFSGELAEMWNESPFRGSRPEVAGFTHIHEITEYADVPVEVPDGFGGVTTEPRDLLLVAEGGSYALSAGEVAREPGGLWVVDITDPTDPVVRMRWNHAEEIEPGTEGEHHNIRYYHEARFLDSDPSVILIADEDLHNGCEAGGMTALRASDDYTTGTELSEWFNGEGTTAGICSVHNFTSEGDNVYIGSYNAGLQIVSYADPENPVRVGEYIAPGANTWGAQIYDGYVYTGDLGGRGLDVFQYLPNVIDEGLIASNPVITQVSGASETLCEQGHPDAPTADALIVELPEGSAGQKDIHATGTGTHPYDLNVYFYDESCTFMSGFSLNEDGRDAHGPIPKGAAYAAIANVGVNALAPEEPPVPAARVPAPPTYVYAQVH